MEEVKYLVEINYTNEKDLQFIQFNSYKNNPGFIKFHNTKKSTYRISYYDGNKLSEFFDDIKKVSSNLYMVKDKEKYNLVDKNLNLIFNKWLDYIEFLGKNFIVIELNNKYNFADSKGKILSSNIWFDDYKTSNLYKEIRVLHNGKWNYFNIKGEIISQDLWFDSCGSFDSYGLALVSLKNKWNYINEKGELLLKEWRDYCKPFNNKMAIIGLKEDNKLKYNFVNLEGEIISPYLWFDDCEEFGESGAYTVATVTIKDKVSYEKKYNFINDKGQLLLEEWVDACHRFHNDIAIVQLDNKFNFVNIFGKLFFPDRWIDSYEKINYDFLILQRGIDIIFMSSQGQIYTAK